jgi:putative transposase
VKKKRFTEEQIAYALAQESTGQTIAEICRKLSVSEQTFYGWKKKFGSMGVAEVCRLKQLEDENAKLKRLVADLSLGRKIFGCGSRKSPRCARAGACRGSTCCCAERADWSTTSGRSVCIASKA